MAAYYVAATRASPLLPLLLKEFIRTFVSDVFQVLNHTHVVFGAVTFVESPEPAAGEVPALIAEPYQPFTDQITMLSHENAILATRQATGTVSPLEPFLVNVMF